MLDNLIAVVSLTVQEIFTDQILFMRWGLILDCLGALFVASAITASAEGSHETDRNDKPVYFAMVKSKFRLFLGVILIILGLTSQLVATFVK